MRQAHPPSLATINGLLPVPRKIAFYSNYKSTTRRALNNSTAKMASSWACSKCTFLNPPTQKSTCQICLSSSLQLPSNPAPSSSSSLRWSCRACTFSNPFQNDSCDICGTRSTPFSTFADVDSLDVDEASDPSIGSVFLPLRRCTVKHALEMEAGVSESGEPRPRKLARKEEAPPVSVEDGVGESVGYRLENLVTKAAEPISGKEHPISNKGMVKILSYNVWFREDLEVHKRMKALGDLIQQHSPDLICFQEVTPNIYEIFRTSSWWKDYRCSVSQGLAIERPYFCMQLSKLPVKAFRNESFDNSIMGRELCTAEIDVRMGKTLVVATSHLESPCPAPPKWDQMYSAERIAQAKQSLKLLKDSPNVIFGGDMNWDDNLDGAFPLPDGWVDAWAELRPRENGWTYDTKANQMLSGNRKLQKRLDRFVCRLQDFKINSVDMIGMEAIPGISYCKEKKVRQEMKRLVLPVLPSDHYGLFLTICSLCDLQKK